MRKIVVLLCAGVLALGLVACGGGNSTAGSEGSASTPADSSADQAREESDGGPAEEGSDGGSAKAVDVSAVDFDVAGMSAEEAFTFMHDFTNRAPDALDADEGKVMHIVGQVSRHTEKVDGEERVSCSVGIKGDGGVIWGVGFYVEGWTADDYPAHKAQVEVTGVWGKVDGYGISAGRTLICNAEDVVVLE